MLCRFSEINLVFHIGLSGLFENRRLDHKANMFRDAEVKGAFHSELLSHAITLQPFGQLPKN